MPTYDQVVERIGTGGEFPQVFAKDVLGDIRTESTVVRLGDVIQTASQNTAIPVLAHDVDAFFVAPDGGLKGVSAPQWASQSCVAEEIAVIVPINDSVVADSSFAIWDAVRKLIVRAFAKKLDRAVMFGVDRPTTWSPSLVAAATTAGQVVDSTDDAAADLLAAAELVSEQELTPRAAAVRSGWQYGPASRTRTHDLRANPITESSPFPLSIAGLPIATDPVAWDRTKAEAIVADWDQVVIGMRENLSFKMFDQGVINDEAGNVIWNAMQNDSVAMRATLRAGFLLKRPVIGGTTPTNPVAVVVPAP